ncbi:MAG: MarR family transcriptional regulator [Clostridia bacterium]|nr:MarR family transcriptional regulator [Clostridia bacterium]
MNSERGIISMIKRLNSITLNPLIDEVNSSEYGILKIVYRMNNEQSNSLVKVSDISKRLNVSTPSVTKVLNSLEKKGLITRKIDNENRRNTFVYITEKGVEVKQQNDKVLAKFIGNVYERVGRENIVQFLHLSEIILDAFDEEVNASSKN